jgi:hypothetical protein
MYYIYSNEIIVYIFWLWINKIYVLDYTNF